MYFRGILAASVGHETQAPVNEHSSIPQSLCLLSERASDLIQAAEIQGSIWGDGTQAGGESFILEGETCRYEGLICCDRFPAEGKAVLGQSWLESRKHQESRPKAPLIEGSQIKPDLKHITLSSEQMPGLFNYISQQVYCFLNFYFLVLKISVLRGNNLGHSGQNRPFLNM